MRGRKVLVFMITFMLSMSGLSLNVFAESKGSDGSAQYDIAIGIGETHQVKYLASFSESGSIGFRCRDTSIATCNTDMSWDSSNMKYMYTATVTGKGEGTTTLERYDLSNNKVYQTYTIKVYPYNTILCAEQVQGISVSTRTGGGFEVSCDKDSGYSCKYTGMGQTSINGVTTYRYNYEISFDLLGEYILTFTHNETGAKSTYKVLVDEHLWGNPVTINSPTCTSTGQNEYTCNRCSKTKFTTTDKLPHRWNADLTIDKNATCTEGGSKSLHCSDCDLIKEGSKEPIPALGHDYKETWTTDKEATCTEKGSKSRHCNRCDSKTDITETDVTGHDFSEWKTIESPNCTDTGSKKRQCTICGYTETQNIDANGHKWESDFKNDKEATCIEDGSRSIHCKNCEVRKDSEIIHAVGHKYSSQTVKATLSQNGLRQNKCSNCGDIKGKVIIYKPNRLILSGIEYIYNGKAKTPAVTIKTANGTLSKNKDYTISYSNGRKNVGKYYAKVVFKGNYSGTKLLYFKINPKGTSVSKLTPGKNKITVKWKKQTSQTTGYQIMYSTSSKFKNGNKYATISRNKTTSKTISKLKSKKKYYMKVRSYKTVNGAKYYSGWSKVRSIKTK